MSAVFRLFGPDDSIEALQSLVHRAYSSLAERGLNYWGTRQTLEDTERRVRSGECWLAIEGERLVGTVLLKQPRPQGVCDWYQREDVRSFHQLAVDPELQGRGLGTRLIRHLEARAAASGAAELALDTSEHAAHLIAWYERLGYRLVGQVDYRPGTNYLSVVMSKTLRPASA